MKSIPACAAGLFAIWITVPAGQDTPRPTVVVDSPRDDRAPAWSPDGRRLAFESNRDGTWDLFVADAAGRGQARLTNDPGDERHPAWSPHGDSLVFARKADGSHAISILTLADGGIRDVVRSADDELLFPAWSVDGRVAYTRKRGEVYGLEIVETASGTMEALLGASASPRDMWPRFSPRGGLLAFFSRRAPHQENDDVYVLAAGGLMRVTTTAAHDFCPAWAPDGRRLVAAQAGPAARPGLVIVDLSGRITARHALGFAAVTEPAWSPDSATIAFAARTDGGYAIYRITDATGFRR